ncbi:hypothetical protein LCGC14_1652230, partial [marine sediment metagenome]
MLVLQALNGLFLEQTEFLVKDLLSWMRFCGLGPGDAVPDANTLWDFREALIAADALDALFARLDRAISEAGYLPMSGQIMDATLVAAPRQRNTEDEKARIKAGETAKEIWKDEPFKARQKDVDARWTVKFSKARPAEDGQKQQIDIANEDFSRAGIINLPITFAILILAFGALLAAAVPLALAFAAIIVAMGALAIISQTFALEQSYSQIVLLMGLASGIDYSLFVISRYRSERRAGRSKEEALQVASGTSGKAIVFAGATTVFAVAGLFLVNDQVFASLGLAAMVVVIFAVILSMTLLPALIAMLGDNVNRLSIPFIGRGGGEGGGVWGRIVDLVMARPLIPAVVTVVALLAMTY